MLHSVTVALQFLVLSVLIQIQVKHLNLNNMNTTSAKEAILIAFATFIRTYLIFAFVLSSFRILDWSMVEKICFIGYWQFAQIITAFLKFKIEFNEQ